MLTKVSSFQDNSFASNFRTRAGDELSNYVEGELASLNGWEEHDRITKSIILVPILQLLDLGWSSDDIKSIPKQHLQAAAAYHKSYNEFRNDCTKNAISDSLSSDDVYNLLVHGFTKSEMMQFELERCDNDFIRALPVWVHKYDISEVIHKLYRKELSKVYLAFISTLTEEDFERICRSEIKDVVLAAGLQDLLDVISVKNKLRKVHPWGYILLGNGEVHLLPFYNAGITRTILQAIAPTGQYTVTLNHDRYEIFPADGISQTNLVNFAGMACDMLPNTCADPINELIIAATKAFGFEIASFETNFRYSRLPVLVSAIKYGYTDLIIALNNPKVFRKYLSGIVRPLHCKILDTVSCKRFNDSNLSAGYIYHNGNRKNVYLLVLCNQVSSLIGGEEIFVGCKKVDRAVIDAISNFIHSKLQ